MCRLELMAAAGAAEGVANVLPTEERDAATSLTPAGVGLLCSGVNDSAGDLRPDQRTVEVAARSDDVEGATRYLG